MSLLDAQNEFSDSQAVTSTAISTNVIDMDAAAIPKNVGGSGAMFLVIQTAVTCTDTSSDATVAFTLESDSAAALNSSPTVHFSTGALAFAAYATAGTRVACVQLPFGDYKRYLGVRYTVASGPLTAGAFDAFLTRDPQFWTPTVSNNPQAR